jgi:hypothetical protein
MRTTLAPTRLAPVLCLVFLAFSAPARAGDVTAFVAFASPTEAWGQGYGAALSSTWFSVVSFEGEAARIPGERPEDTMTSFTGSALLAPPIRFLIPYGGLGVGVFRQSVGSDTDTGVMRCLVLGIKLKAGLVVVKGEFRKIDLPAESLLAMDKRFSVGAGISF